MPVTADLKAPSNIVKEPQIVFVNVEGEECIRKLWLYDYVAELEWPLRSRLKQDENPHVSIKGLIMKAR